MLLLALPAIEGEEFGEKNVGHVSTIMRLLTRKSGDVASYFDKIDEKREVSKGS